MGRASSLEQIEPVAFKPPSTSLALTFFSTQLSYSVKLHTIHRNIFGRIRILKARIPTFLTAQSSDLTIAPQTMVRDTSVTNAVCGFPAATGPGDGWGGRSNIINHFASREQTRLGAFVCELP